MANYPLHRTEKDSKYLTASSSSYSNESAYTLCNLYLRSELYIGEDNKDHVAYRLRAYKPHTAEDAADYAVCCPKCNHVMKRIGRCLDSHVLGLYECPVCEKR